MLPILLLSELATLPTRAHEGDACLDLYAAHSAILSLHSIVKIKTNIAIELPLNTVGILCDRSGLASKGITVLGGIVDESYRGDYTIILAKIAGDDYYTITAGDKICQLLIIKYESLQPVSVESLSKTKRGANGFGSSGK